MDLARDAQDVIGALAAVCVPLLGFAVGWVARASAERAVRREIGELLMRSAPSPQAPAQADAGHSASRMESTSEHIAAVRDDAAATTVYDVSKILRRERGA